MTIRFVSYTKDRGFNLAVGWGFLFELDKFLLTHSSEGRKTTASRIPLSKVNINGPTKA